MSKTKESTLGISSAEFRKELQKIMPGYQWTIHKNHVPEILMTATGIVSSGFNRLSTLHVERRVKGDSVAYTVRSAGFGTRAKWLHETTESTLPRALRELQSYYEKMASMYSIHASDLKNARG